MNTFSPFNSLEDVIKNQNTSGKFEEFFRRMKRKNGECPEDDDCGEVISPCCELKVVIIFGSLPLKVECSKCKKKFLLKNIL